MNHMPRRFLFHSDASAREKMWKFIYIYIYIKELDLICMKLK